ncbi:MAG TPA: hypothetical protein VK524_03630 [Polyangiaceae bacterium]|nr:hypothetical protein [Polyangiaceae bacterium]
MRVLPCLRLISCATLAALGSALGQGCSDEEVNVPVSDAGTDRTLPDGSAGSGGSGGTDSGSDGSHTGSDRDARSDSEAGFDAGPLAICLRLSGSAEHEQMLSRFTPLYLAALRNDCRLTRLTQPPRATTLPDFGNQLRQFNFSFWGCDSRPLSGFDIVYQPQTLTALDIAALIDSYVGSARTVLSLSPTEELAMRAELGRLGALAQTSNAATYTFADCDAGREDGGDASSDATADASVDADTEDAADAESIDEDGGDA